MSPDDPSPISGIQGKHLPFRDSYPPIKHPYLPFPRPDPGRFQPARISPGYPYGDRGHSERPLTRPRSPMASLLSSNISVTKFKKAQRTFHALSPHVGSSPDPKKTDVGFSLSPIMASTKNSMVAKSPHTKKVKAHRGKHDRHKHSSRHQKHAKAHRDISSTEKDTGPEVDSDLLTLRGCALSALSKPTAAGRTKLQQPQQQQQAESPAVSVAEDQPPTIAIGQLHAQQQGNWQTTFAEGPCQASPSAGAAPNSPEICQKTLGLFASEHPAQAGAHVFPSSLQAPSPQAQSPQAQSPQARSPQARSPQAQSPQAQLQLITFTKGYAETSSTPTNAVSSDWHVMTTAGLASKSVLCTTDSPDAGTKPDHDMPDLGIQCITKPMPAIKQVTDALSSSSSTIDCLAVMHYIPAWCVLLALMRQIVLCRLYSLAVQVTHIQTRCRCIMHRNCL